MSSRRFLLLAPPSNGKAILEGDEAHHLRNVLRAEPGRRIEVIDGSGRVWSAVILGISDGGVDLGDVTLVESSISTGRLALVQSLCKSDKLEWILEKCTELGIDDFFLLDAARSVVRIPKERLDAKMERWRKIILAAVKQSRRNTIPVLHPPRSTSLLCQDLPPGLKLLLSENERGTHLRSLLRSTIWDQAVFCVGPEGGWTQQEQHELARAGFQSTSLGPHILRTETAAIVVTAILKYEREGLLEIANSLPTMVDADKS